jgi:hypothetical protein
MSKRAALITAGVIMTIGGGLVASAGGAAVAAVGSDSTLSTGHHTVTSTTSALVTREGDINDFDAGLLGHPAIKLSVTASDKAVFVGVGPADAVRRYLAGARIETVTDVDVSPFHLVTTVREGSSRLASPVDQTFWVARSDGTTADTTWKSHGGSYRMVVMNADGSPGIDVDAQFGLHVRWLTLVGWSVLAGGLGVLLIGVTVLVLGLRTRALPAAAEPAPSYETAPV